MKILSIVGARPNFMKIAPIIAAIEAHNASEETVAPGNGTFEPIQHVLLHTGQHYDSRMSDSFFADLHLPNPDISLGVGPGSHAVQTAEIIVKFERALLNEKPDLLVVVGDVTSTIACALVAAKIPGDASWSRPLIAHVEAGLRSFDRGMPEEINRILTDHLADLLFVTEESGIHNLSREGISAEKIHFVGNTMIDSLLTHKREAESSGVLESLNLCKTTTFDRSIKPYALLTLHRPANVDSRDAFFDVIEGLDELARQYTVIFPVHPRTRNRIAELGLEQSFARQCDGTAGVLMIEPLGYLDFVCLMMSAKLVVTDSGGIQEETTCLGIPCVTVRENTERPVTLTDGTNILAGVDSAGIRTAVRKQLNKKFTNRIPEKWDGRAATRIVEILLRTNATQRLPEASLCQ